MYCDSLNGPKCPIVHTYIMSPTSLEVCRNNTSLKRLYN